AEARVYAGRCAVAELLGDEARDAARPLAAASGEPARQLRHLLLCPLFFGGVARPVAELAEQVAELAGEDLGVVLGRCRRRRRLAAVLAPLPLLDRRLGPGRRVRLVRGRFEVAEGVAILAEVEIRQAAPVQALGVHLGDVRRGGELREAVDG